MAQYYHVLSQNDKKCIEDLRQYYPNIVENQTVQYVISAEEQRPQLQGQQIIVTSGEQLIVVDSESQSVVIEQPQIYQGATQQQYLDQDSKVKYQESDSQQVYYTEEGSSNSLSASITEQPLQTQNTHQGYYMKEIQENNCGVDSIPDQQIQQPIILNHQIQTAQPTNQLVTATMPKNLHAIHQQRTLDQIRQVPGQIRVRQELQVIYIIDT